MLAEEKENYYKKKVLSIEYQSIDFIWDKRTIIIMYLKTLQKCIAFVISGYKHCPRGLLISCFC